jgi:hypothetical protein
VTDLAAVLAALQACLESDPLIGLDGSDDGHLRVVAPNVDWIVAVMPSAALLVTETTRTADDLGDVEQVACTIEIRLAIDGFDGRGDVPGIVALVEGVRRVVIQNNTLAVGNPLTSLIGASQPTGETYEVLQAGERGWIQTATFRWWATWLQTRTFEDARVVDARYVRVLTIVPGEGVTEQQPPA